MRLPPFLLSALLCVALPAQALRVMEPMDSASRLELLAAKTATDRPLLLVDGDVVHNPVRLFFNISGNMKIAPAGDMTPHTGHFHLLIDTTLTPEQMEFAIPNDAQHIHYGKGQTEATITLPPGRHTLQLVLGDGGHMLHKPPVMSKPVTVTVE